MIRKYIEDAGYSVRQFARHVDIPYSTMNDITTGKVTISNIRFGHAKRIADALKISLDELFDMDNSLEFRDEDDRYSVIIRNKSYYIVVPGYTPVRIGKVNAASTKYIRDFAKWEYELLKEEEKLNAWEKDFII